MAATLQQFESNVETMEDGEEKTNALTMINRIKERMPSLEAQAAEAVEVADEAVAEAVAEEVAVETVADEVVEEATEPTLADVLTAITDLTKAFTQSVAKPAKPAEPTQQTQTVEVRIAEKPKVAEQTMVATSTYNALGFDTKHYDI